MKNDIALSSRSSVLTRRDLFALGGGALLVGALPAVAADAPARPQGPNARFKKPPLKVFHHRVEVGAAKPFTALHVTDSHLTLCNSREKEPRKVTLAMARSTPWPLNWHYLEESVHYARTKGATLLHTGDLIDFVSIANLEAAGRLFCDDDWFVSAGNHEYSKYVGEAKEDEKYKHDSYGRVQEAYPNDLTLASRVINGVNFVAFDCVYHYVPAAVPDLFEKEVAKGLPIVLMCHNPLYSDELWAAAGKRCGPWFAGVPADPATGRKGGDPRTVEFVRRLRSEKLVRAVITGHIHHPVAARFSPTAMQYVGGCGAEGVANELAFF